MKKRLLSTLLFVVMVMTLLPASAFAASGQGTVVRVDSQLEKSQPADITAEKQENKEESSSDTDEGKNESGSAKMSAREIKAQTDEEETLSGTEIISAHFYADAGQAKKAIEDIISSLANKTSDTTIVYEKAQTEEAPQKCVNNTLVVRYTLDESIDYALQISVGNESDKEKGFELSKKSRMLEGSPDDERNLKEYLFIYHIPEEVQATTYTVKLGKADTETLSKINQDGPIKTKSISLVNTVIDFGVLSASADDNTPTVSDIIESEAFDNKEFYNATESQKSQNQITVIADPDLYKNEDCKTDADRLSKLIRFKTGYDETFLNSETGNWIYTPAVSEQNKDASFVWRYNLPALNIAPVEQGESLFIIKNGGSIILDDNTPLDLSSEIQLKSVNQLTKTRKSIGDSVPEEDGYWIGFKVTALENATELQWSYKEKPEDNWIETRSKSLTKNEEITFYVNAYPAEGQTQYPYFRMQFFNNSVELTRSYTIHIDLTQITLNDTLVIEPTFADNVMIASVDARDKIEEQIRIANKTKKIIIDTTKPENTSFKKIQVGFSAGVAASLSTITDNAVQLIIKLPYGTLTIPQSLFSKIFVSQTGSRSADSGPKFTLEYLGLNLNTAWFIQQSVGKWMIDAYQIDFLDADGNKIDLDPDDAIKFQLNDFQRVKDVSISDKLWALKLDSTGAKKPEIISQNVECEKMEDNETLITATFPVSSSGWYAIAPKSFVNDSMNIFDEANKIEVFENTISEENKISLKNAQNEANDFNYLITDYTAVTTADTIMIKSDQEYARYVDAEGVAHDSNAGVCEFKLNKVYNPITIKIGSKQYNIAITKKPKVDSLSLELVELIGRPESRNMCRIQIVGAAPNRQYLVQQTRLLEGGAAITANAIVESDENGKAYFYAGYPTNNKIQIAVKVYEINEKEESPFVVNSGLINCKYEDGVDRVIGVHDSEVNDPTLPTIFQYGKDVTKILKQSVQ